MFSNGLWPILFLISLCICIGILACLTVTAFHIILERHITREEARYHHAAEEDDSPREGYCTFERCLNGALDDDAPTNGQRRTTGMLIMPRNFRRQQKGGGQFHAPAVTGHARFGQPGAASENGRDCDGSKGRVSISARDGGGESVADDETLAPSTDSAAGSRYAGDYGEETASTTSSLAAGGERNKRAEADTGEGREELMFDMSV
ncbi:hypothetical protein Trco_007973 [Trichoderma cornu-damae]|uniref:Uncharacterized protein n=1 Tax=Trichoderma cornu-damae TaxID=654480 RepID=A0A9P8QHW2_9HYPO|nr:hypothetical protein Trco_007973 [Trichoderma cornu-damae]